MAIGTNENEGMGRGRGARGWAWCLAAGALVACAPPAAGNDAGTPEGDDAAVDDDALAETQDDAFARAAPVLVSASAAVSGRFGDDVRVAVRASDADGDLTSLSLALFDAAGQPIVQFDGDGDGLLDSNQTVVTLSAPIVGPDEGDGLVVLVGLELAVPTLAALDVGAVDALGLASATQHVMLTAQPIVELGGICDPGFVDSRCADGLGCPAAVPSICVAGAPPALTRAAYMSDPGAVRVLVEGTDADDDVSELVLAFFDASDAPVELDLDGDGVPESTTFHARVSAVGVGGHFFYAFDASDQFAIDVAAVGVTAIDRGMHESDPMRAPRAAAPTRNVGQTCDPSGFDRCIGSVCLAATGGGSRCVAVATARTSECGAAPVLDAFGGPGFVEGDAAGPSLWDAPAGCSSGDPVGRPEGSLRLHLDRAASSVVLSTDNAYTTFDTTIYVMASCGAAPVVAWCGDDTPGSMRSWLSHLELTSVPAGDYVVVVDSFSPAGGHFRLDVTATE